MAIVRREEGGGGLPLGVGDPFAALYCIYNNVKATPLQAISHIPHAM